MNKEIGIYLVTDTAQCGRRGVVETVRQAVTGGVRTVQVRDKGAGGRDFLALVLAVADAIGDQATVLVNDRVDVYLAARLRRTTVHGVHIGQDDLPVAETRRLIGSDAILGVTANLQGHFDALAALPSGTVDYLGVGVIHPTASKSDHPAVLGVEGFGRLARSTPLPCVAIGGVTAADVGPLRQQGAAGAAVISAICASDDPFASARSLTIEWESGRRSNDR